MVRKASLFVHCRSKCVRFRQFPLVFRSFLPCFFQYLRLWSNKNHIYSPKTYITYPKTHSKYLVKICIIKNHIPQLPAQMIDFAKRMAELIQTSKPDTTASNTIVPLTTPWTLQVYFLLLNLVIWPSRYNLCPGSTTARNFAESIPAKPMKPPSS